jgi:hypothetical protein
MRSGQSADANVRQVIVLAGLLLGAACGGRTESLEVSAASDGAPSAGAVTSDGGSEEGAATPDSMSSSATLAACDHYFSAQYARGCGGPEVPADELARIRARFEQVCQNQYALPGSGITPAALEVCASALEKAPCRSSVGPPVQCMFQGTLAAGAPCNESFQCQGGFCNGTVFSSPDGQLGPTTCGTCSPGVGLGEVCQQGSHFVAGCPAGAECTTANMTASVPTSTCVAETFGDVGAACDDGLSFCKAGLYCAGLPGHCEPLATAGAPCGYPDPGGGQGSDGCAPPLSCVGLLEPGTCSLSEAGIFCVEASDCSPGLVCKQICDSAAGCRPYGTCVAVSWAKPGQSCQVSVRCLVGSCSDEESDPALSPDGGLVPSVCPQVIPDGQTASSQGAYATCDTFAVPFLTDSKGTSPSSAAPCLLLDSVVCK